jgi:hypothetical protein
VEQQPIAIKTFLEKLQPLAKARIEFDDAKLRP